MFKKFRLFLKEMKLHKGKTAGAWNYFFKWNNTFDKAKSSLELGLPWFTFQVISLLNDKIKPGQKVFEYGGGGSTMFFLNKNCEVYTVEHHSEWFENIKKAIAQKKFDNKWQGSFITPGTSLNSAPDKANPLDYFSADEEFKGKDFRDYARSIEKYPDSFFDVILIDGRARPSCLYHSLNKLKKGGYLILDNTEREYYTSNLENRLKSEFNLLIDEFGPVPFTNWFHKTTAWRKK